MRKKAEQNGREEIKFNGISYCIKSNLNLVPYWFLSCLRIILTLLPQNGYIHPDEYFQSVEVLAGDVFDIEVSQPWEFNTTFPIRSVALSYLTMGIPFSILKSLSPFLSLWFNINIKTPYLLLVLPRLTVCLLSFVSDYSLYKICYAYGQNYQARLIIFASSYVVLVYGTRTFSNTIEMVLESLLLYMVADCMAHSDQVIYQEEYLNDKYKAAGTPVERVKFYKLRRALPKHSLSSCFAVASLTVAGIFNRPTFLAFAFPPVFFWLHRGLGSKTVGLWDFHLRILLFTISGLPAAILLILIDSFYYGYLTMSEIIEAKLTLNNFVVTPANFLKYNIDPSNLSKHGLHPHYLHFLVNVPLLYNVLGVVGIAAFLRIIYRGICGRWSDLPRIQSIVGLMTTSFIIPVTALSVFPHQEARFLIPVTLPLVFLHSQHIRHVSNMEQRHTYGRTKVTFARGSGGSLLLSCWYLCNMLLTILFGFLHQGGVYPLISHFSQEMHIKPRLTGLHLVTSHTYSMPLFLMQLRNSKRPLFNKDTGSRYRLSRGFHSYEMGSEPMENVNEKLEELLTICERKLQETKLDFRLYLALPASLVEDFHTTTYNLKSNFSYSVSHVFYPHVSTEALPRLIYDLTCSDKELEQNCELESFYMSPLKYLSRFVQQFGLTLMKIER